MINGGTETLGIVSLENKTRSVSFFIISNLPHLLLFSVYDHPRRACWRGFEMKILMRDDYHLHVIYYYHSIKTILITTSLQVFKWVKCIRSYTIVHFIHNHIYEIFQRV